MLLYFQSFYIALLCVVDPTTLMIKHKVSTHYYDFCVEGCQGDRPVQSEIPPKPTKDPKRRRKGKDDERMTKRIKMENHTEDDVKDDRDGGGERKNKR